ncbi:unnamed protein product [Gongylonema pulchrum]|uniref:Uncharacterized protein n=1 Tax=Gongylonema pulchrum TaxID=637853 RepID=A0A3P6R2I4_9BILA|nr:unnamed protein product [Gongylonema pulchrum]
MPDDNDETLNEADGDEWRQSTNTGVDDEDEFMDAAESIETMSDIYDRNVQIVPVDDAYENVSDIEKEEALTELGIMLNSTLASEYEGANVARLNAHFWQVTFLF